LHERGQSPCPLTPFELACYDSPFEVASYDSPFELASYDSPFELASYDSPFELASYDSPFELACYHSFPLLSSFVPFVALFCAFCGYLFVVAYGMIVSPAASRFS
jgi:hypothetical protein